MGLLTDLDGTIAELVSTPQAAQVNPVCHQALKALAKRLALVAVVTGRSVEIARRMVNLTELLYIGNHGLERWEDDRLYTAPGVQRYLPRIQELAQVLRGRLPSQQVLVEEKGTSLAVHYRLAPHPEEARKRVLQALQEARALEWARLLEGKLVVNVLPPGEYTKGSAAAELVGERGLQGVVFLGDDVTDLSAFQALHQLAGASNLQAACIAILRPDSPAELVKEADYTLGSVEEVGRFLGWWAEQGAGGARAR
ncbi:MAG: trehalose-phosphatase [Dehalococcoidia bacterium]